MSISPLIILWMECLLSSWSLDKKSPHNSTPSSRPVIDEWYASDCFLSQQHSVDIVVDADGAVTHVVRWATKEAFLRDQGIQCKEFDAMFGKIAQIGGADLKMSATTSIAPSPR